MSRLIPAGWQILDPASVALFQESLIRHEGAYADHIN